LQIFDDTTCVVRAVLRWTEFYAHESCGKCTPCREGTYWLVQILDRLERGEGRAEELDQLLDISDNILGRAFCALGDGAVAPITSSIQYFRDEYLAHLDNGGCPFDPAASAVFSASASQGRDGVAANAAGSPAGTPDGETPPDPSEGTGARADD
jgi:NADH-quinone oxidoreductase subunit F